MKNQKLVAIIDIDGLRHNGIGIMYVVQDRKIAEYIAKVTGHDWDGCEGHYNTHVQEIRVTPESQLSINPSFCVHKWKKGRKHYGEALICEICGLHRNLKYVKVTDELKVGRYYNDEAVLDRIKAREYYDFKKGVWVKRVVR